MNVEVARIANATPVELVVISYEIILDNFNQIMNEDNKLIERKLIEQTKGFVRELTISLDMKYDISINLKLLYDYVNKLIVKYEASREKKHIVEANGIIHKLYMSWTEIEKKEIKKESVMQNAESIYCGLTYGVNGLNETVIGNTNKGFRA